MAKPKRFSNETFILQLDKTIEKLINHKKMEPELAPSDIKIQDIADAFAVNSATLRRWCQEHTALSPRQYLAIYRVERAKYLLDLGVRSLKISQQLAFTEHKVFSTLFKRIEGVSPSDYLSFNIANDTQI